MKIKSILIVLSLLILLNVCGCIDSNDNGKDNPTAIIDTSMGEITIELFEDKTPNTVANFIQYVEAGFYDDLVFHRVISGRMIQGGGYYSNGTYKKPIYDPIALEIHEDARHIEGAIGIGPSVFDTNLSSQFYICVIDQSQLDDKYPIFGKVIDGMDVVRSISNSAVEQKYDLYNWPVDDVIINSIVISEDS